MHWLRRAFVGAAAAWPMALLLAPVAAARPQPSSLGYGYAFVMYAASSLICHQRPERSFHLLGAQLPVCARCMGIYAGAAVAACLWLMRPAYERVEKSQEPPRPPRPPRKTLGILGELCVLSVSTWRFFTGSPSPRTVLLVAALPTAATLIFEWTTGHTPGNWTRAVSGVPVGAAVAWIVGGLR